MALGAEQGWEQEEVEEGAQVEVEEVQEWIRSPVPMCFGEELLCSSCWAWAKDRRSHEALWLQHTSVDCSPHLCLVVRLYSRDLLRFLPELPQVCR